MDGKKEETRSERRGFFASLRSTFFTGLVVIAPAALTIYIIWTAIEIIDNWVLPWIPAKYQPATYGYYIPGYGVVIFLIFTILVGALTRGFLGRTLIRWGEDMVAKMPVVRSVYRGLKQIVETVLSQSEANFEKACLVEYPRKGLWAVAFVATRTKGEIWHKAPAEGEILSVFLPTTPNPTSGFLLFVPADDVIMLDMSVEDAAKLVISAGLVVPEYHPDGAVTARPAGEDGAANG